jgi:predicted esterase
MSIHHQQPVLQQGRPLGEAAAAMILIHGRGATAESILELTREFSMEGAHLAYLAPQAAGMVWYPNRFVAPRASNEPYLSSALAKIEGLVAQVLAAGIPAEKLFILGFSQGACLALDYAARHPRRYGGLIGLSGGLIGETLNPADYSGNLEGTPAFLGCSDVDFHIPLERVQASTAILSGLGAAVTERIYPNMGHTVNHDEIRFIRQMLAAALPA